ncbi:MAG TPA: hypothetical protein VF518_11175 [Polyangia bacterium]
MVPVFAVIFGVALLREPLTWNLFAGGLTVSVDQRISRPEFHRGRMEE